MGKRDNTNVPAQSLILMNDPFVMEQANNMAQNVLINKGLTDKQKITWIYLNAFSRKPLAEEIDKAITFISEIEKLQNEGDDHSDTTLEVWTAYCHSIFNLKEFIYLI